MRGLTVFRVTHSLCMIYHLSCIAHTTTCRNLCPHLSASIDVQSYNTIWRMHCYCIWHILCICLAWQHLQMCCVSCSVPRRLSQRAPRFILVKSYMVCRGMELFYDVVQTFRIRLTGTWVVGRRYGWQDLRWPHRRVWWCCARCCLTYTQNAQSAEPRGSGRDGLWHHDGWYCTILELHSHTLPVFRRLIRRDAAPSRRRWRHCDFFLKMVFATLAARSENNFKNNSTEALWKKCAPGGFAHKPPKSYISSHSTDFRSFVNYMRQLEFYDFSLI